MTEKLFMNSKFHVFFKRFHWWGWQIAEYQEFVNEWRYFHNGIAPDWLEVIPK